MCVYLPFLLVIDQVNVNPFYTSNVWITHSVIDRLSRYTLIHTTCGDCLFVLFPSKFIIIDRSFTKKKKTIYLILNHTILHLLNCILSFPTYSHSIHFLEYYDNNSNNKTIKFMITKKEYKNNYNQIDCTTLLTKYFILSAQHRIAPQRFLKNYYSPHTIPI